MAVCGLKTSFYGLLTPFCTAFVPIDLLTGFSLPVNRGLVLGNSNRLLLFLQVTPVRDLSLVIRSLETVRAGSIVIRILFLAIWEE